MEYKVSAAKKAFEPITVTITLENINELKSLWARLDKADTWSDGQSKAEGARLECHALWKELDTLLESRG